MLHLLTLTVVFGLVRSAEICCPDIGCFTDDPPYDGQPLPTCPEEMNPPPVYMMYTRSNRIQGQVVDKTTIPSVFDGSRQTVFLAHGWMGSGNSGWPPNMKNAFLDKADMNVVIVNWEGGANDAWYPRSAANTRTIGALTAVIIANLKTNGPSTEDLMWAVGHSLGGHVVGHTGMRAPIARATGLDPAGPWFEISDDPTVGLNPTSAKFVDVIHTDTTYGTLRNLGHIDFYPGGGTNQPGCGISDSCSHGRAVDYMTESIQSDCYLTRQKCTSYTDWNTCTPCNQCGGAVCAIMGYNAPNSCDLAGLFYLDVNANAPFCQN